MIASVKLFTLIILGTFLAGCQLTQSNQHQRHQADFTVFSWLPVLSFKVHHGGRPPVRLGSLVNFESSPQFPPHERDDGVRVRRHPNEDKYIIEIHCVQEKKRAGERLHPSVANVDAWLLVWADWNYNQHFGDRSDELLMTKIVHFQGADEEEKFETLEVAWPSGWHPTGYDENERNGQPQVRAVFYARGGDPTVIPVFHPQWKALGMPPGEVELALPTI